VSELMDTREASTLFHVHHLVTLNDSSENFCSFLFDQSSFMCIVTRENYDVRRSRFFTYEEPESSVRYRSSCLRSYSIFAVTIKVCGAMYSQCCSVSQDPDLFLPVCLSWFYKY